MKTVRPFMRGLISRCLVIPLLCVAPGLAGQELHRIEPHLSEPGLHMLMALEGRFIKQGKHLSHGGNVPHVGYGHRIRAGEFTWFKGGLSESGAQTLLRADVEKAEKLVAELVQVTLKQHEFDALVMLAFNVGEEGLRGCRLIKCLNAGDRKGVAELWMNFTKTRNHFSGELKASASLMQRRRDELYLFRTGQYLTVQPRNAAEGLASKR